MKARLFLIAEYVLVALVVFGVSALTTYPLIFYFQSRIPGWGGDAYLNSWLFWWFTYAIQHLKQWPLVTHFQFFPNRIDISGEFSLLYSLLLFPISAFGTYIAAYNTRIFLSFLLTGVGMYYAIKHIVRSRVAAFFSSFFFTFSYIRFVRMMEGHVEMLSTEWYGWYLAPLFHVLLYQTPGRAHKVMGICALVFLAYTDYRNFAFMLVFTILILSGALITFLWRNAMEKWVVLVKYVLVVWLAVSFCILPLVVLHGNKLRVREVSSVIEQGWSVSAASFVTPPRGTWLSSLVYGEPKKPVFWPGEGKAVYLGIVPIVFAGFMLLSKKRHEWTDLDIVLCLAGAGSMMLIFGLWERIYSLLTVFPLFKLLRVPGRFVVLLEIPLVFFAGIGVHRMFASWSSLFRVAAYAGVMALALFETVMLPVEFLPLQPKRVYDVIAADAGENIAVLEIPFGFGDVNHGIGGRNRRSFMSQPFYRAPMFGGYLTWVREDVWARVLEDSVVQKLASCQERQDCLPFSGAEAARFTQYFGVKYVIVHDSPDTVPMVTYLAHQVPLFPVASDGDITIYRNGMYK